LKEKYKLIRVSLILIVLFKCYDLKIVNSNSQSKSNNKIYKKENFKNNITSNIIQLIAVTNIKKDFAKETNTLPQIENREENKPDQPGEAYEQDYERTKNPILGRPTPEVLAKIVESNLAELKINSNKMSLAIPGSANAPWVSIGPKYIAGRTKALAWDPNDIAGKKVWAGGVTGGIWYNNDITDSASSWNKVDDFWGNLYISNIVFDPLNTKIIYATTGSNSRSAPPGVGIYKSTDAGLTWNLLPSTANFYNIVAFKIRIENGSSVLYSGNQCTKNGTPDFLSYAYFNPTNYGLYSSSDGGLTWTDRSTLSLLVPYRPNAKLGISSIDINKTNNRIWISTNQNWENSKGSGGRILYNDSLALNGLKFNKSDSLLVDSASDNKSTVVSSSYASIAYSIISNGGKIIALRKTDNGGSTWTTLNSPQDAESGMDPIDFSRGQAWVHQAIAVDPNDPNIVLVGGIDLFISKNGGTTWKQISRWSETNPGLSTLTKISTVHADQLNIVYKPGSSNEVIFGTDGGIFYSANIKAADTTKVIQARNKNYNITQFYSTAIHPGIDSSVYLAGAQDNGTQLFQKTNINVSIEISGGDGGYCFIDQYNPSTLITSYTYNNFYKQNLINNSQITLLNFKNNGQFINYAAYDNNLNILYTNRNDDSIYRVSNIINSPKIDSFKITGLVNGMPITSMMVSPFNESTSTLYLGTKDTLNKPKFLKISNAQLTPQTKDISSSSFPNGGNISSIAFGRDSNEIAVTFYNYGISSVWYTSDGGTNWQNKDNTTLPNIPIRWAVFNPNKYGEELVLATELGIYATKNLSASSPTWTQVNNGFANVRTDMLQLRNSDFSLVAATYGRGLFSSTAFSEAPAPIIKSITTKKFKDGDTLIIKGNNFTNTNQVKIGGYKVDNYNILNDTTIKLIIGGTNSGRLSIKTPGGIVTMDSLKYSPPLITSFTPTNAGLNLVMTIKGINLKGINSIKIGGRDALKYTIVSDSIIQATIPDSTQDGVVFLSNGTNSTEKNGFKTCITPSIKVIGDTTFCEGGKASLSVTKVSTVKWYIQDSLNYFSTDTIVNISKTGSYIAYVFANNCYAYSKYSNIVVNSLPTKPIVTSSTICEGQNATITTPSGTYTYTWIVPTGVNTPSKSTNSFTTTKAGTYSVSLTNINGCISEIGSGTVTVNNTPTSLIVRDTTYCNNSITDTLKVLPTTGNSLLWYGNNATGGIGSSIAIKPNTSIVDTLRYYVSQKSNTNSCESPRSKIVVVINPVPNAPIVRDTSYCINATSDSLKAIVETGNTLLWYGNNETGGNRSILGIKPSTVIVGNSNYYVSQVNNLTGCESSRSKIVITIKPNPNTPTLIRDNNGYLLSGSNGTSWYKDGIAIIDTSLKYKPTTPGSYTAKITLNGCTSSFSNSYYFLVTDLINLNDYEFIKLAPNPFFNNLNFDFLFNENKKLNLDVFSFANGSKVYSSKDLTANTQISLSQLSSGIYLFLFSTEDGKLNYKFKIMKL